jgi:phage terminase large subunit-like protein
MTPTPRQSDFLNLTCREALYGGAAGGGKSEALLMWLAEGVHLADYSAIIFRRTFKQLKKSNDSLWAKAWRLYRPMGAVPNKTDFQWKFPSGALIEMGAMEHEDSVEDYTGNSYHRVAYDELTLFSIDQYEHLVNSRIRSAPGYPITLGARAASNPGGIGHDWVKKRFVSDEAIEMTRRFKATDPSPPGTVYYTRPDRAFIPARVADNPYIDLPKYVASLSEFTNAVKRERLMNGDWSIMPDGLIKAEWLSMTYTLKGDYLEFRNVNGDVFYRVLQNQCRRIITIDTRGTSKEITRESKGKPHSWTVMQVWDQIRGPQGKMLMALRHVDRKRQNYDETKTTLAGLFKEWKPILVKVENASMGNYIWSDLRGMMPIVTVQPDKDKVGRATKLLNMLEQGQVFLPRDEGTWKPTLEAEWLSWQGLEDETNDQVDAAAYAALDCGPGSGGSAVMPFDIRGGAMAAIGRR